MKMHSDHHKLGMAFSISQKQEDLAYIFFLWAWKKWLCSPFLSQEKAKQVLDLVWTRLLKFSTCRRGITKLVCWQNPAAHFLFIAHRYDCICVITAKVITESMQSLKIFTAWHRITESLLTPDTVTPQTLHLQDLNVQERAKKNLRSS